jgi:microcystin-dependent protein
MSANAVGANSGGQPHDNVMPFLCVNFIIALEGIFPSRN